MQDVDELISRAKANGHDVWVAGAQSPEDVDEFERGFGAKLPPSYREFLLKYGEISIADSVAAGMEWLTTQTEVFREDYDLPDYLRVVQPDHDAPYCFDIRRPDPNGEMPIICFELHSRHEGKIASNFGQWLRDWFLKGWAEDN
ncbi:MAG: hypothetical protein GC159_06340 [Phycisphaera sp.]|nr:hypothetical protein [Phycisphaera sp.]